MSEDKYNQAILVVLVIISLWSTYMFGYNQGFDKATTNQDVAQNKTLNALQLANDYQEKWFKCIEVE